MKQKKRHSAGRKIKILAVVRISKASGRDMLSGMFRFIEQNPSWQLHLVQYDSEFTADVVRSAPADGFDGIVVTSPGAKGTLDALAETPLPVVLVSVHAAKVEKRRRPTVFIGNDNCALGRIAATSFLKNGNYAEYAYIPKTDEDWCEERGESFAAALAQGGRQCSCFASQANPSAPVEDADGLVRFLSGLAKPAAVYAASDECALKVLAAAHAAGIRIPEHLALIGTDNDEFLVRHSIQDGASGNVGNEEAPVRRPRLKKAHLHSACEHHGACVHQACSACRRARQKGQGVHRIARMRAHRGRGRSRAPRRVAAACRAALPADGGGELAPRNRKSSARRGEEASFAHRSFSDCNRRASRVFWTEPPLARIQGPLRYSP